MVKLYCRIFLWFFFLAFGGVGLYGQDARLSVSADHKSPEDFFMELSLQSGINIIYSDNVISRLPDITLQLKGVNVEEILEKVLHNSSIRNSFDGDQIVLYPAGDGDLKYTISGVVTDTISGEPLISAYVYEAISGKSTSTNNYGYYSLTLPSGRIELMAGYL